MIDQIDPQVLSVLESLVTVQLAVTREQLTMEAKFIQDLGADSLDMVDIMLSLEEKLDLRISETELVHMTTVGEALSYLTERLKQEQRQVAQPATDALSGDGTPP